MSLLSQLLLLASLRYLPHGTCRGLRRPQSVTVITPRSWTYRPHCHLVNEAPIASSSWVRWPRTEHMVETRRPATRPPWESMTFHHWPGATRTPSKCRQIAVNEQQPTPPITQCPDGTFLHATLPTPDLTGLLITVEGVRSLPLLHGSGKRNRGALDWTYETEGLGS